MTKRTITRMVAIIAGLFVMAGCTRQSGLEGKIVDSTDAPISGLKVIVRQIQPVKGYERFETTTASDGKFRFKALYPSSDYWISVRHKDWQADDVRRVTTRPAGEILQMTEPIKIRFVLSAATGIITDFKTHLEWMAGPDTDTTWDAAKTWCAGLSAGGGGWRMPKKSELETLYVKGLTETNMPSVFHTTGWGVWSDEQPDALSALNFRFHHGLEGWNTRNRDVGSYCRAFAVRERK